jgi:hypothetical protein
MLSAIVLSVIMLNIIILNFIMLNRREKILYYSLPNGARTVRQMLKCQMTIYQKAKVYIIKVLMTIAPTTPLDTQHGDTHHNNNIRQYVI